MRWWYLRINMQSVISTDDKGKLHHVVFLVTFTQSEQRQYQQRLQATCLKSLMPLW